MPAALPQAFCKPVHRPAWANSTRPSAIWLRRRSPPPDQSAPPNRPANWRARGDVPAPRRLKSGCWPDRSLIVLSPRRPVVPKPHLRNPFLPERAWASRLVRKPSFRGIRLGLLTLWRPFASLKGWHSPAQGNALGTRPPRLFIRPERAKHAHAPRSVRNLEPIPADPAAGNCDGRPNRSHHGANLQPPRPGCQPPHRRGTSTNTGAVTPPAFHAITVNAPAILLDWLAAKM
jgi:hypothetical protein